MDEEEQGYVIEENGVDEKGRRKGKKRIEKENQHSYDGYTKLPYGMEDVFKQGFFEKERKKEGEYPTFSTSFSSFPSTSYSISNTSHSQSSTPTQYHSQTPFSSLLFPPSSSSSSSSSSFNQSYSAYQNWQPNPIQMQHLSHHLDPDVVKRIPYQLLQPQHKDNFLKQVLFAFQPARDKFLHLALPHSMQNIEFMGILIGKMMIVKSREVLVPTQMVIPKQLCTADRCTALNMIAFDNYRIGVDLIYIGWFHSHPSFRVFFSTVDNETHYSFQRLLPESFGTVYSGIDGRHEHLRLTDMGMSEIMDCVSGHARPEPHYHDEKLAVPSNHVFEISDDELFKLTGSYFYVKDLRNEDDPENHKVEK